MSSSRQRPIRTHDRATSNKLCQPTPTKTSWLRSGSQQPTYILFKLTRGLSNSGSKEEIGLRCKRIPLSTQQVVRNGLAISERLSEPVSDTDLCYQGPQGSVGCLQAAFRLHRYGADERDKDSTIGNVSVRYVVHAMLVPVSYSDVIQGEFANASGINRLTTTSPVPNPMCLRKRRGIDADTHNRFH